MWRTILVELFERGDTSETNSLQRKLPVRSCKTSDLMPRGNFTTSFFPNVGFSYVTERLRTNICFTFLESLFLKKVCLHFVLGVKHMCMVANKVTYDFAEYNQVALMKGTHVATLEIYTLMGE